VLDGAIRLDRAVDRTPVSIDDFFCIAEMYLLNGQGRVLKFGDANGIYYNNHSMRTVRVKTRDLQGHPDGKLPEKYVNPSPEVVQYFEHCHPAHFHLQDRPEHPDYKLHIYVVGLNGNLDSVVASYHAHLDELVRKTANGRKTFFY
jgi:hypothetical protein